MKSIPVIILAAALSLASGCASKLNVAEILQQQENTTIHTQCNLWHDADNNISSINYQTGKIIPFGTQVSIIKATDDKIVFKSADGQTYRVNYHPEWMMMPIQNYIRQIFTTRTRAELAKDLSSQTILDIERGQAIKGMDRRAVLLTCGPPPAYRTPSLDNDTWVYWSDKYTSIRVIFKDGKVADVISIK